MTFPIFIGITGKREFASDPTRNTHVERDVRGRISLVLDYIDAMLPAMPKVLLTGGAKGADLLAAKEVLGAREDGSARPGWLVLVVMPFAPSLYRQDFEPEQWADLDRVIGDPRTRTLVLPPLHAVDGMRASDADLVRKVDASQYQKDLRRRHYEQVGLWIADTANVLIAVMPADEPANRIGGTARIVAYRRGGRPDNAAAQVVAASEVLAPRRELQRPSAGHVWLIDPAATAAPIRPPIVVLPPYGGEDERARAYVSPGRQTLDDASRRTQDSTLDLRASTVVLEIAGRYARELRELPNGTTHPRNWPTERDPIAVLQSISDRLRQPGYQAADRSRDTFYKLAGLFLLATFTLALFVTFVAKSFVVLGIYAALVGCIMQLYFRARLGDWQAISEDRRAIREVLRVQIAWWQAGLDDRVDHVHLQGADLDLARVREAARNLITWAQLACPNHRPFPDWTSVFAGAGGTRRDWVGSQRDYFKEREHQREAQAQLSGALSWMLFATSAWLVVILVAWLASPKVRAIVSMPSEALGGSWLAGPAVLGCILAGCGLMWLRGWRRGARGELQRIWLSVALAFLLSIAIALAIGFAASLVGPPARLAPAVSCVTAVAIALGYGVYWWTYIRTKPNAVHLGATSFGLGAAILFTLAVQILLTMCIAASAVEQGAVQAACKCIVGTVDEATRASIVEATQGHTHQLVEEIAEKMMGVLVAVLAALAGAMRFVNERLAVEAEALSYRDARGWFEHADALLAELRTGSVHEAADERARAVVRRLGTLALEENEDWLLSRRERPLSPII